jgi:hypothetical protein
LGARTRAAGPVGPRNGPPATTPRPLFPLRRCLAERGRERNVETRGQWQVSAPGWSQQWSLFARVSSTGSRAPASVADRDANTCERPPSRLRHPSRARFLARVAIRAASTSERPPGPSPPETSGRDLRCGPACARHHRPSVLTHVRVDPLGVVRTEVFYALSLSPLGRPADIRFDFDLAEPTPNPHGSTAARASKQAAGLINAACSTRSSSVARCTRCRMRSRARPGVPSKFPGVLSCRRARWRSEAMRVRLRASLTA